VTCPLEKLGTNWTPESRFYYPRGMKEPRSAVLAFVFAILLSLATPLLAKCPADTVEVRGKIEYSFKPDDKVLATLIFRDRQPEASGPETALDIHEGRFDGRVAFDTYSSSSLLTGDRCYRRPKFVLIRLIEADGFEMDRMSLKTASDFNYNENQGEYSVRSAVILRGWCQPKCAETQATPWAKTK
jgi:hypothetical protein